jgi:hypothetical protein
MKPKIIFLILSAAFCLLLADCKKKENAQSGSDGASSAKVTGTGEAVDLKVNWPVGRRFRQRLDVVVNSESVVPNQPQPMKQNTTMGQEFAFHVVKERPGGGRELEMQIGDIEMSVSAGGRDVIAFDSKGEAVGDVENPVASAFRQMVGAKIKYLTDASNRVEKIEGWQELVDALSSKLQGPSRSMVASMFKEEYFKQMAEFGQNLPGRSVRPGESWPVKTDVVMGPMGTATLDLIYTFKGWEQRQNKRLALLVFSGTISSKPAQGGGAMGMTMSIENGTISGKSWFDPAEGLQVESVMDQNINMSMTMPARATPGKPAAAGELMTIQNKMSQKIKIKVTPEEAK